MRNETLNGSSETNSPNRVAKPWLGPARPLLRNLCEIAVFLFVCVCASFRGSFVRSSVCLLARLPALLALLSFALLACSLVVCSVFVCLFVWLAGLLASKLSLPVCFLVSGGLDMAWVRARLPSSPLQVASCQLWLPPALSTNAGFLVILCLDLGTFCGVKVRA